MNNIKIQIYEEQYGYRKFKFREIKTGSYFQGIHSIKAKNIEKIKFKVQNSEMIIAFHYILIKYTYFN